MYVGGVEKCRLDRSPCLRPSLSRAPTHPPHQVQKRSWSQLGFFIPPPFAIAHHLVRAWALQPGPWFTAERGEGGAAGRASLGGGGAADGGGDGAAAAEKAEGVVAAKSLGSRPINGGGRL